MKDTTSTGASFSATMPYLTPKLRIGNCKGPISYKLHQLSFHRSDIPANKIERVEYVNASMKSKILSNSQSWNTSTATLKSTADSRTMENFVHDRSKAFTYNYRAESLDPMRIQEPVDRPTKFHISHTSVSSANINTSARSNDPIQQGKFRRTEEIPVNRNLSGKVEWNSMTSYSIKEKEKKLLSLTKTSRDYTAKVSETILKSGYINPVQIETLYGDTLRKSKRSNSFVPLSKSTVQPTDLGPMKNQYALEKSSKYYTSEHSGVWAFNNTDKK